MLGVKGVGNWCRSFPAVTGALVRFPLWERLLSVLRVYANGFAGRAFLHSCGHPFYFSAAGEIHGLAPLLQLLFSSGDRVADWTDITEELP